jgi:hypothetical protein
MLVAVLAALTTMFASGLALLVYMTPAMYYVADIDVVIAVVDVDGVVDVIRQPHHLFQACFHIL